MQDRDTTSEQRSTTESLDVEALLNRTQGAFTSGKERARIWYYQSGMQQHGYGWIGKLAVVATAIIAVIMLANLVLGRIENFFEVIGWIIASGIIGVILVGIYMIMRMVMPTRKLHLSIALFVGLSMIGLFMNVEGVFDELLAPGSPFFRVLMFFLGMFLVVIVGRFGVKGSIFGLFR